MKIQLAFTEEDEKDPAVALLKKFNYGKNAFIRISLREMIDKYAKLGINLLDTEELKWFLNNYDKVCTISQNAAEEAKKS